MNDKIITLSLKEIDQVIYYAAIPRHIHDAMTMAVIRDQTTIEIKEFEWLKIQQDTAERQEKNKLISDTATLNNKGIAAEKENNEAEAIEYYESNISQGGVATHAYDRLMKIYRRLKDYDNEERIIQAAIDVFTVENDRRYLGALKKPENASYIEQLAIAHKTNKGIKNEAGWYIYSPYDIVKYVSRIDKVKKLKS